MSAQRKPKVEFTTEQQLIDKAMKEGRCTLQDVSMKAIGRQDARLQPRVERINMDHVRKLAAIRKGQGFIAPIVVFDDEKARKMYVPSGWHRLEEHRIAREPSIRAYVIKGDWDEAVEFAAATNQETLLPRTSADIEKQLGMIFAIPRWWTNSNQLIADHVGVSQGVVAKYRLKYSGATGTPVPEYFRDALGRTVRMPARKDEIKSGTKLPSITQGAQGVFRASVLGKEVRLGRGGPEDAKKKLIARLPGLLAAAESGRMDLCLQALSGYLGRRSVYLASVSVGCGFNGVSGLSGHGRTIVSAKLAKNNDSAIKAVGSALLLREFDNPAHRAVVACYPEDGPEEILDLGRRLGIEFLTPEQLVASIKGDGGEAVARP